MNESSFAKAVVYWATVVTILSLLVMTVPTTAQSQALFVRMNGSSSS